MSLSRFEFKKDLSSEIVKVAIAGKIDEHANFEDLNLSKKSEVVVDLNLVDGINSLGVKAWIKWISSFPKIKITFHNCPKIIIDQINMLPSFFPKNAKVMSLYVPYFNEDSGEEKYVLFKYGREFGDAGVSFPTNITDGFGLPMEPGIIETRFFKFLSRN